MLTLQMCFMLMFTFMPCLVYKCIHVNVNYSWLLFYIARFFCSHLLFHYLFFLITINGSRYTPRVGYITCAEFNMIYKSDK